MVDELDKPLKYVIFAILYIQIFSFMFHPKIKVQMLICVLVLTAIAAISIVYDMHNGIGESKIKLNGLNNGIMGSFVKLLPNIIQEQFASAPIGWFIGFIAFMNLIAILLVTKMEYKLDSQYKLSNKNAKKMKNIKGVFISIVISIALMGIISFLLFGGTFGTFEIFKQNIDFSTFKNKNALVFLATYTFFASVYTLDTSRKLHKLFVNNLITN